MSNLPANDRPDQERPSRLTLLGVDLRCGEIPLVAGQPVHTGFGMAAVLHSELDPTDTTELIESVGDPRFTDFSYETIGLMMAAYQRDLFGGLTAIAGRLGLLQRPPFKAPHARSVVAELPLPRLQLAAHGYGRMLYFKTHRFSSALDRCRRSELLPFEGLVRGLTIACALVNCRDLCRVLERTRGDGSNDADAAVDGGMVDALLLFAWAVPGFLDRLEPRDERSRELIRAASEQAEEARTRGLGPPLMAWNPATS